MKPTSLDLEPTTEVNSVNNSQISRSFHYGNYFGAFKKPSKGIVLKLLKRMKYEGKGL